NHHSPFASDRMVQQENPETSKPDSRPVHVAEKVGPKKFNSVEQEPCQGAQPANRRNNQGLLLPGRDLRNGGRLGARRHCCDSRAARSSLGTSATVAFSLSCSTRIYAIIRQRSSGSTRDP